MRIPFFALVLLLATPLVRTEAPSPSDAFLIACAERRPECEAQWSARVPATFATRFTTSSGGSFTVDVVTSRAPAMASRFYLLSRLHFFDHSPLYRVLHLNTTAQFVAQWGYRGVPLVDSAWITHQTSNKTEAVSPPGNIRGAVAFGTSEVKGPLPPYCTASECSVGFSVELFVNLADNARLDDADFSVFGSIDAAGMAVLERVYAGYGELSDICGAGGAGAHDEYCVSDGKGGYAGVNLTTMLARGWEYLHASFPRLDYIVSGELLV